MSFLAEILLPAGAKSVPLADIPYLIAQAIMYKDGTASSVTTPRQINLQNEHFQVLRQAIAEKRLTVRKKSSLLPTIPTDDGQIRECIVLLDDFTRYAESLHLSVVQNDFLPLRELINELSANIHSIPDDKNQKKNQIKLAASRLRAKLINDAAHRPRFFEVDHTGDAIINDGIAQDALALLERLAKEMRHLPAKLFTTGAPGRQIRLSQGDIDGTRDILTNWWHEEYCEAKGIDPNESARAGTYPLSAEYCRYRHKEPTNHPERATPSDSEIIDAVRLCNVGFSYKEFFQWWAPRLKPEVRPTEAPAEERPRHMPLPAREALTPTGRGKITIPLRLVADDRVDAYAIPSTIANMRANIPEPRPISHLIGKKTLIGPLSWRQDDITEADLDLLKEIWRNAGLPPYPVGGRGVEKATFYSTYQKAFDDAPNRPGWEMVVSHTDERNDAVRERNRTCQSHIDKMEMAHERMEIIIRTSARDDTPSPRLAYGACLSVADARKYLSSHGYDAEIEGASEYLPEVFGRLDVELSIWQVACKITGYLETSETPDAMTFSRLKALAQEVHNYRLHVHWHEGRGPDDFYKTLGQVMRGELWQPSTRVEVNKLYVTRANWIAFCDLPPATEPSPAAVPLSVLDLVTFAKEVVADNATTEPPILQAPANADREKPASLDALLKRILQVRDFPLKYYETAELSMGEAVPLKEAALLARLREETLLGMADNNKNSILLHVKLSSFVEKLRPLCDSIEEKDKLPLGEAKQRPSTLVPLLPQYASHLALDGKATVSAYQAGFDGKLALYRQILSEPQEVTASSVYISRRMLIEAMRQSGQIDEATESTAQVAGTTPAQVLEDAGSGGQGNIAESKQHNEAHGSNKDGSTITELRLNALRTLLRQMERRAKERNINFDIKNVRTTQAKVKAALTLVDSRNFHIAASSFSDFWKQQQLCGLARGRSTLDDILLSDGQ